MGVSRSSSAAFLLLLGVLVGLMASPSQGYVFHVGGRDGWALSPSETYGHWAQRNRFQVNDTLVFKYSKGENSVLEVSKEDYDSCNVQNPIVKMDGGDSTFVFNRSGPFYFISGVPEACNKGQKVTVVVLSVRNRKPSLPPAPVSSPPSLPPSSSPPPATSPTPSPAPSSSVSAPSPSPTSISGPPARSPAPGNAPVPVPSLAPSPAATSPSPQAQPPTQVSPPTAPSPDNTNASGSPAPTPSSPKSGSSAFTAPVVLVLSMALGAFLM